MYHFYGLKLLSYPVYGVLMKVVSFPSTIEQMSAMDWSNEILKWMKFQFNSFYLEADSAGSKITFPPPLLQYWDGDASDPGQTGAILFRASPNSQSVKVLQTLVLLPLGDNLFTVPLSKDCNRFFSWNSASRRGKWLSIRRLVRFDQC